MSENCCCHCNYRVIRSSWVFFMLCELLLIITHHHLGSHFFDVGRLYVFKNQCWIPLIDITHQNFLEYVWWSNQKLYRHRQGPDLKKSQQIGELLQKWHLKGYSISAIRSQPLQCTGISLHTKLKCLHSLAYLYKMLVLSTWTLHILYNNVYRHFLLIYWAQFKMLQTLPRHDWKSTKNGHFAHPWESVFSDPLRLCYERSENK